MRVLNDKELLRVYDMTMDHRGWRRNIVSAFLAENIITSNIDDGLKVCISVIPYSTGFLLQVIIVTKLLS